MKLKTDGVSGFGFYMLSLNQSSAATELPPKSEQMPRFDDSRKSSITFDAAPEKAFRASTTALRRFWPLRNKAW